jgi:hypothetical protein
LTIADVVWGANYDAKIEAALNAKVAAMAARGVSASVIIAALARIEGRYAVLSAIPVLVRRGADPAVVTTAAIAEGVDARAVTSAVVTAAPAAAAAVVSAAVKAGAPSSVVASAAIAAGGDPAAVTAASAAGSSVFPQGAPTGFTGAAPAGAPVPGGGGSGTPVSSS